MRDSFEKGFLRVCWSIARDWVGIPKKEKQNAVSPATYCS